MNHIDSKMLKFAKEVLGNQFSHKTFYFKKGTNPKYCVLMGNPDKYINKEKEELNILINNENNIESFLDFYIGYLIEWILHDNGKKPFFKPFFEIVLQKKINSDFKEKLINDDIFNEFYFSDIIKYRSDYIKDNKIKINKDMLEKSVKLFREEISILSNIQLIFVFGNVAFKSLMSNEEINIIKDTNNILDSNRSDMISELHGSLYRWFFNKTREIFIIPLIHMSRRNVTIRDTYFDYFKKGLTKYREIAKMKK